MYYMHGHEGLDTPLEPVRDRVAPCSVRKSDTPAVGGKIQIEYCISVNIRKFTLPVWIRHPLQTQLTPLPLVLAHLRVNIFHNYPLVDYVIHVKDIYV